MVVEKSVKWTCPHCNNLHYWYWDEDDIFEGEVNMNCDSCRRHSKQMMHINPVDGNAWCEHKKEPYVPGPYWMTSDEVTVDFELEELKKKAERIQKRIQELEEEKKKNEYKSLHNVIAKWEYYYSERLEKRILYADSTGKTCSYRDIVEEEINNLLEKIHDWIDEELSFNQTAYTAEYFIGWDECRKTLKKKLRSDSDFYGKTK
jgi:hypothetical protein